ncbi:MAG: serine hydrolase domain-containing protein [Pseudomonadota bacterium]
MLGLALLGGMGRALASTAPARSKLDIELAAIARDPAIDMASLSVLAIRRGRVVYEQQFGWRSIGSAKLANARTLYRMASISKMMTTFGLMRLVEQGKCGLDTDVSDYLGFKLRNPHFPERAVTLRALLTHTSSLRDDAGYSWPASFALKDILVPGGRDYGNGAMWASNAAPGDYFTYCNLGWGVIGTLMERITGERFDRLMKRLLLDPLGLHGGYHPSEFTQEDLGNLATLYRKRTTDTEVWNPAGPWIAQVDDYSGKAPVPPAGNYFIGSNATPYSPTGGCRMSAADMGKVMQMLINQGQHEGRQILKPETIERMFTRQWTYDGKGGNGACRPGMQHGWGMGNQQFGGRVLGGPGFSAVGHLGDAYGLLSVFAVDRASGNGMIVLCGGTGTDQEHYRGDCSALAPYEEQILASLYREAIQGEAG